jgi:hypothetical protein
MNVVSAISVARPLTLQQRLGSPCLKKIGHALTARDLVSEDGRRTLALGPRWRAEPGMAHLIVAMSLDMARKRGPGDLTNGRPQLATWMRRVSDLPAMRATALP